MAVLLIVSVAGDLSYSFQTKHNESTLLQYLNRVKSFYCEKALVLDVIRDSDDLPFELDFFQSCTCFRLTSLKKEKKVSETEKKIYNLIFLKSYRSFQDVLDNLSALNFDRSGYFSLIFFKANHEDVEKVLQLSWKHFMHNVNVIDAFGTHWTTFEPFLDGKSRVKTATEDFFPNKLRNLHSQPLRLPVIDYWPGVEFKNDSQVTGIEGKILTQLAYNLNFTIRPFHMENEDEKWGKQATRENLKRNLKKKFYRKFV